MRAETRARRLQEAQTALAQCHGNQVKAAILLGISRETMGKYARALRAGAPLSTGAPTVHDRYLAQHVCRDFLAECTRCQMERALFLLNRARFKIDDPVLRHDIEDALHRWPLPVRTPDPVAPGDPCPVPEPVRITGSETEDPEPRKKRLTAGSSPAMVPVLETVP